MTLMDDDPNLEPTVNQPTPDVSGGEKGRGRLRGLWLSLAALVLVVGGVGGGYWGLRTFWPDQQEQDSKVKVAVMMAFSGGSSSMGYGALKGVQLAQKQLEIDNIEVIQMDSKCDAKTAGEAVRWLIEQGVVVIIGEGCSSASVAALPAANNARVVMLSPSASSPTLSIPDDYFFRVVPPDTMQGSFMAQSIYDRGIRRVAVFYTNEPYGSGMNTAFREAFESLGGKVVATSTAEPDVIDLAGNIQSIQSADPEAVFIAPNSALTATAVVNLTRAAGMDVPLFGADILYDETIIQNGREASEGLIVSTFPTGTDAFKQSLASEYQKTEQLYAAAQAYDVMHILQIAVERGARTGQDIKQILPSIKFDGVSGPISFDSNGEISDPDYEYDLFEIRDGEFRLL